MPAKNHQAVARRQRSGIVDAHRQFVLQQHPAVPLWFAEHTAFLAVAVAGLHAAEIRSVCVALAGVAAEAAAPIRKEVRSGRLAQAIFVVPKQLSRSLTYKSEVTALDSSTKLLINSLEDDKRRLDTMLMRIL